MKFRKMFTALALTLMVVPLGVAVPSANSKVAASSKYTVRTFPKSIRGTWYNKVGKHIYKTRITSHQIKGSGFTENLKVRRINAKIPSKMKHESWAVGRNYTYKGQHWLNVKGWYQSAGDGEYYTRTTHRLGGKQRSMLQTASGAGIWTDGYSYRSKRLAKLYGHKFFSGDRHQSVY